MSVSTFSEMTLFNIYTYSLQTVLPHLDMIRTEQTESFTQPQNWPKIICNNSSFCYAVIQHI